MVLRRKKKPTPEFKEEEYEDLEEQEDDFDEEDEQEIKSQKKVPAIKPKKVIEEEPSAWNVQEVATQTQPYIVDKSGNLYTVQQALAELLNRTEE